MTAVTKSTEGPPAGSCVELFSGLGGLAIGLDRAGWEHKLLVERDRHAAVTLRGNALTSAWPLRDADLRDLDLATEAAGTVDLLAAGVPCQPFSQGGAHAGPADERNMFPETFSAIRQLQPKAVLIENVRGLARPSFKPFVDYIVDHLSLPSLARRESEDWPDHHERLRVALRQGPKDAKERYHVEWRPVCVADYGVPQRRVRVIIVAIRSDLSDRWTWPEPTHSQEVLLYEQLSGSYWGEHGLAARSPRLAPYTRRRVERAANRSSSLGRWRTLRDALDGLPEPTAYGTQPEMNWHSLWPGAKLYRGHRGSELDRPSKTIKAGVHGVAGGEHIVHLDSGEFRYLTVRECMRVQDLPDEMELDAVRSVAMRQIGNAVPPPIGEVFGRAIADAVLDSQSSRLTKEERAREQDEAAGGYLARQVVVGGKRVTASVRIQKGYAYLYWTRSAGKPLYLGRVDASGRAARLSEAWAMARSHHPGMFVLSDSQDAVDYVA